MTSNKKEESLELKLFKSNISANLLSSTIVFFYAVGFVSMRFNTMLVALAFIVPVILVSQYIIAPITNMLITRSVSRRVDQWRAFGLSEKDRTELLIDVMKIPRLKCIEAYLFFIIIPGIATLFFYHVLHTDIVICIFLICTCAISSYVATVFAYHIDERICSSIAQDLISQGISDDEIKEKKFFGFSTLTMFLLYIIVPFILCTIMIMIVVHLRYVPIIMHDDGAISTLTLSIREQRGQFTKLTPSDAMQIRRMLFVCGTNFLLVSFMTFIYFTKLDNYTKQMREALKGLSEKQMREGKTFKVDLSTDLSYTMYLINQTILMFYKLLKNTDSMDQQIYEASQNLAAISNQAESTSMTQTAGLREIIATMESTQQMSRSMETKISEVNNVATTTAQDVIQGFDTLQANLKKMQEITAANQVTIDGIQTLNNKIASIKEIVNMINGVSDQTKIIAFNAELESGNIETNNDKFKDVAHRIRELTDKNMELTKQIKDQILEIQDASSNLIITGQMCSTKIAEGNDLTEMLKNKFLRIREAASDTAQTSTEIKASIEQQITAFQNLLAKLQQISSSMDNFGASIGLITDSVNKLNQDAKHLHSIHTVEEV